MANERLFLDTSFVLGVLNDDDQHHAEAMTLIPRVRAAAEVWTTDAVLAEIANRERKSDRERVAAWIGRCYVTPNFRIVNVGEGLFQSALAYYRQCADKEYSLTDCISFVVMTEKGLTDAVTSDKHFRQAGFQTLMRSQVTE